MDKRVGYSPTSTGSNCASCKKSVKYSDYVYGCMLVDYHDNCAITDFAIVLPNYSCDLWEKQDE